jgi:hypothetical protein
MAEYAEIYTDTLHADLIFLVKYYRKRATDDQNPVYGQVADDILDRIYRRAQYVKADDNG